MKAEMILPPGFNPKHPPFLLEKSLFQKGGVDFATSGKRAVAQTIKGYLLEDRESAVWMDFGESSFAMCGKGWKRPLQVAKEDEKQDSLQ